MQWDIPPRPAEIAETRLIGAILDSTFPIHSNLPAERELAAMLGVTRPTLREALQRLARDGWLEIHQGRPTRVRDYWVEGNLGVLGTIAQSPEHLPEGFVTHLLEVRLALAPTYACLAVARAPERVAALLAGYKHLNENSSPEDFTRADWALHHILTVASGNPIYTLILNGFRELYSLVGPVYFSLPAAHARSHQFYTDLLAAAESMDSAAAEIVTRDVMLASLAIWQEAEKKQLRNEIL